MFNAFISGLVKTKNLLSFIFLFGSTSFVKGALVNLLLMHMINYLCVLGCFIIFERSITWCIIRCVGPQILFSSHSVYYLCPNATHGNQSLVSTYL